jgi:hypothetical protein
LLGEPFLTQWFSVFLPPFSFFLPFRSRVIILLAIGIGTLAASCVKIATTTILYERAVEF